MRKPERVEVAPVEPPEEKTGSQNGLLGFGQVAAAAVLWGTWALFLRPSGIEGPAMAVVLMAVMSLPLPWVIRKAWVADRPARVALLILGIADAGNTMLYFAAVKRGPIAVAVMAHYLAPLLVALASPWLSGDRWSLRTLIATPISLVGLGLLIGVGGQGGFAVETALLGAGSGFFYAVTVFTTKRAARAYSAAAIAGLHAPISIVCLFLAFGRSAIPTVPLPQLGWAVAGALVCGLLGTVLFSRGLARVPAPAASALTYIEPVTAALVGVVVFGEALGLHGWVGAAIILACGAWVATRPTPTPTPTEAVVPLSTR